MLIQCEKPINEKANTCKMYRNSTILRNGKPITLLVIKKLINLKCPHCGQREEPLLTQSGPHIKAECIHCNMYIKFINKDILPTLKFVRFSIWILCEQDLSLIKAIKEKCSFKENRKGIQKYIQYWKLYIEVIKSLEYLSK